MLHQVSHKPLRRALLCGMLGCLLLGASDWLMIYGDTAYEGSLAWLTAGVAQIPPGRNALALGLSFPAVVLYAAGLIGLGRLLAPAQRRRYLALNTVGMTPWLALHLFYVMILFLFGWLHREGQPQLAFAACEALFGQFAWVVVLSEVLMLLPFLYLFGLLAAGRTGFPRWMCLNNPLVFYLLLKALTLVLPDVPARLAFVNGLMSEAMLLWFLVFVLVFPRFYADQR